MMFLEGFWKVLGPTSLLKYFLSVEELMRAQLICSIVGHIWHAVWLILLLVVSDLSTFVCSVKHQVSKEQNFCKYSLYLSNNNLRFLIWGLAITSLTRIDEYISIMFSGLQESSRVCLDQLLPDSHHCSGSLDLNSMIIIDKYQTYFWL